VGEVVYIVKPELRAPLGEFRVSRAHPGDKFELVKVEDGTIYPGLIEGVYLRREF